MHTFIRLIKSSKIYYHEKLHEIGHLQLLKLSKKYKAVRVKGQDQLFPQ